MAWAISGSDSARGRDIQLFFMTIKSYRENAEMSEFQAVGKYVTRSFFQSCKLNYR
jgi:hypothetical protein